MKFRYSIDGVEGTDFEAEDLMSAYERVLGWMNASIWEVSE
jgi:hypothetical protein